MRINWKILKFLFSNEKPWVATSKDCVKGSTPLKITYSTGVTIDNLEPDSVTITTVGGCGGGKLPLDAVADCASGGGKLPLDAVVVDGAGGYKQNVASDKYVTPKEQERQWVCHGSGGPGGKGGSELKPTVTSVKTNVPYKADTEFALFINEHLAGKEIKTACVHDTGCPVHEVRIGFTDGTAVGIHSEHDEGFIIEHCEPLGGGG